MKKFHLLLATLALTLLSQLAFATETPAEGAIAAEESSIHIGHGAKIKSKLIDLNLAELKSTIKISYPQIIGTKLSPAAQQFNKLMLGLVTDEMNRFTKYVKLDLPHMQTLPADVQNNSLNIDYDIDVIHPNHNTVIMVRFDTEGMQAGRAHPYHNRHVVNYDLSQGKVLALADLFKPKANFLKLIAEYSRKQLLQKSSDPIIAQMVKQGTKVEAKNFKNWNIQNDTLLFTFDEYQVAPYVNGPQEVEIPYAALKNVIAPNSVIHSCVMDPKSCGVS
jgi:hypothetical protein